MVALGVANGRPWTAAKAQASATLVETKQGRFLLTAQHVVNDIVNAARSYQQPWLFVADSGVMATAALPLAEREPFRMDVAAIPVGGLDLALLPGKSFLRLDEFDEFRGAEPIQCLGFPATYRVPDVDRIHTPLAWGRFQQASSLGVVRFCATLIGEVKICPAQRGPIVDARGMSGGPVLVERAAELRLVGVLSKSGVGLGTVEVALLRGANGFGLGPDGVVADVV